MKSTACSWPSHEAAGTHIFTFQSCSAADDSRLRICARGAPGLPLLLLYDGPYRVTAESPKVFELCTIGDQSGEGVSGQAQAMPVFRSHACSSSSSWPPSSTFFRILAFGRHSGGAPVAAWKSANKSWEKSAKLVILGSAYSRLWYC